MDILKTRISEIQFGYSTFGCSFGNFAEFDNPTTQERRKKLYLRRKVGGAMPPGSAVPALSPLESNPHAPRKNCCNVDVTSQSYFDLFVGR